MKEHEPKIVPEIPKPGDIKIVNGEKYIWKDTGYTVRQYFSHSTEEKGPGPGWDQAKILRDDEWALKNIGRTFSMREVWGPEKLPDTPYYQWEPYFEE